MPHHGGGGGSHHSSSSRSHSSYHSHSHSYSSRSGGGGGGGGSSSPMALACVFYIMLCVGFGVGCWLVFAYVSFPSAITGTLDLEPYQQILVTYDPSKYTAYSVMGAEGTVIYKFTEAPPSLIGTCVNSTDTFTFVLGQDKYEYYGYYLTIGTTVDFSWHFDSSLYFDVYLKDETMYSSHGRTGSGRVTAQQDGEYIFQVENSYVTAYSNTGYYTLTITRPEYDVSGAAEVLPTSAMGSGGSSKVYLLVTPPETPCTPKYCKLTLQLDVSRVWFWVAIGLFIAGGLALIPLGLCVVCCCPS
ncbi:hypothetical protein PAPYR_5755 [Paratrimastix pyriformis]|uniref:Uncharacterized protein n=1 Tax=Paratrimastix pyriformis TaxID=342808 RepID=A0ABQ8UMI0_9EUKA|nr:hypothetical protein PAPYR_5755 [Paratrimastix pyriformis]|eukprot:GAFH01002734.1.p1 GENE.GAFH01002734.1~~GAFH01002734.1.p1  ORF type:complete len:301 (+),score=72.48 GAFH01002734.1:22-924(+)